MIVKRFETFSQVQETKTDSNNYSYYEFKHVKRQEKR